MKEFFYKPGDVFFEPVSRCHMVVLENLGGFHNGYERIICLSTGGAVFAATLATMEGLRIRL